MAFLCGLRYGAGGWPSHKMSCRDTVLSCRSLDRNAITIVRVCTHCMFVCSAAQGFGAFSLSVNAPRYWMNLLWNCSCNLAVSTDHLPVLMQALRGQVLRQSMDAHGCRLVQRALSLADDAGRLEIARELRGHICEVLESPHGNHVLQRIIELMRPSAITFVLCELTACMTPQELAKHRYGCRILERIIEHFPPRLLATSVDALLADAWDLCRHVYGNFVIQHLLEHGEQAHRRIIIDVLCSDLKTVALDPFACNVLDKGLSYGSVDDQQRIASIVLREGALSKMARLRNGFAASQRLMLVARGDCQLRPMAEGQLADAVAEISLTRHGRALLASVLPDSPLLPASDACTNQGRHRRRRWLVRR